MERVGKAVSVGGIESTGKELRAWEEKLGAWEGLRMREGVEKQMGKMEYLDIIIRQRRKN
jgi:hypothetical protein